MYTATTLHLYESTSAKDIASYLSSNLAVGDYYSERGKSVGNWSGSLVRELGIDTSRDVSADDEQFLNLLRGQHPATGAELKYRPSKKGSVCGYDFVVDPHKSVSVMAMFDKRIVDAHERANAEAMAEIERNASRRLRTGDVNSRVELPNQFTGNFLSCSFTHDLSRANDPQLHTHNFIFNLTKGDDGRFYALDQKEMRRSIRYFSHVYNAVLARELEALGYGTEAVKRSGRIVSFKISGVSQSVCDAYSERSRDIEHEAEIYRREKNLERALSVSERNVIARASRTGKENLTETEKIEIASAKISPEEWAALARLQSEAVSKTPELRSADLLSATRLAVDHLFERKSAVSLREIASEAMLQNFGAVEFSELKKFLSEPENLEKLGLLDIESREDVPDHERAFTTLAALGREEAAVEFVNRTKGVRLPFNPSFKAFSAPEFVEEEKSGERDYSAQRRLVENVLNCCDTVVNVRGKAGTGKTTMLKELVDGIRQGGGEVVMLAPTHTAKDELIDEGFQASTVAAFLRDAAKGGGELYGKTFIVDEAGLLSSRQGADLLHHVENGGNRVVFVGDTRQHSSVDAGDFVRGLEVYSEISTFELSSINRQTNPEYRSAVEILSEGRVSEGLEALDELGWIREHSDYIGSAVEELRRGDFESPGKVLFVGTTNADVDDLNERIRARLKDFDPSALSGAVEKTTFRSRDMTDARAASAVNYDPGDVIEITYGFNGMRSGEFHVVEAVDIDANSITLENGKTLDLESRHSRIRSGESRKIEIGVGECVVTTANDKRLNLVNGEALTVRNIAEDGALECVNKQGVVKNVPSDWRHLRHGYAVTSHKSQGRTVDRVVVAARELDGAQAYVSVSRGRRECVIHTPSKDALFDSSSNTRRPLALEALDRSAERERLRETALKAEKAERMRRREMEIREVRARVRNLKEWMEKRRSAPEPDRVSPEPGLPPPEIMRKFEAYSQEFGYPMEELLREYKQEVGYGQEDDRTASRDL